MAGKTTQTLRPYRHDNATILHGSLRESRKNLPVFGRSAERRSHERAQPPRAGKAPLKHKRTGQATEAILERQPVVKTAVVITNA